MVVPWLTGEDVRLMVVRGRLLQGQMARPTLPAERGGRWPYNSMRMRSKSSRLISGLGERFLR
jgi:hypothetical protein